MPEAVSAVAKYKWGSLPLDPLMGCPSFKQSCTSTVFYSAVIFRNIFNCKTHAALEKSTQTTVP